MPSDKTFIIAPGEGGGGQTQFREETTASELSLPLLQWRTLVKLRIALAVAYAVIFLVWSPWSFLALGLVVIGLLVLRLNYDDDGWYCDWRGGNDPTALLVRAVVIPCLLVAWLILYDDALALAWPEHLNLIILTIPLRRLWHLHVFWRLAATVPSGVLIWSYPDLAYRMRAEVTDPSWSAPIAPRAPDTGPAFPGAEIRSAGAEPVPLPLPPDTQRVVVDQWRGREKEQPDYDAVPLLEGRNARERLRRVAQLYQGGASFSEPQLAGKGLPLTGPEFRQLREKFLRFRWVRWIDEDAHNLGVRITPSGERVLDALAEDNGRPPHPAERGSGAFSESSERTNEQRRTTI